MSTLIVYATKYGCTEKCVKKLAEKLSDRIDLYNIKGGRVPDLSQYDRVIIGGSAYVGKIQKEVSKFCLKNLDVLKSKKVGLFICGMNEPAINAEFSASYPQELLSVAAAKECFGGEYNFKKMNFLERMIVKKIAGTDKDVSNISEVNIYRFAQAMNK